MFHIFLFRFRLLRFVPKSIDTLRQSSLDRIACSKCHSGPLVNCPAVGNLDSAKNTETCQIMNDSESFPQHVYVYVVELRLIEKTQLLITSQLP